MVQDFLPGFLEAEAEAREAMISETERQVHLAKQFIRFDKMAKVCKSPSLRITLEKYKQQTLKLMEHQHV